MGETAGAQGLRAGGMDGLGGDCLEMAFKSGPNGVVSFRGDELAGDGTGESGEGIRGNGAFQAAKLKDGAAESGIPSAQVIQGVVRIREKGWVVGWIGIRISWDHGQIQREELSLCGVRRF